MFPTANIWGLFVLDIELSEDKDIQRQLFIYIMRKTSCELLFADSEKCTFFFFSMSMYVPQSWCDFRKAYIHRLRVAYNFVCRALYNLPWWVNVTSHQVQCNIPSFGVLLRKKCISVSWKKSNNAWLRVLMKSDCLLYRYSSLFFEQFNRILLCGWVPGGYSVSWRRVQATKPSYVTRT